MDWSPHAAKQVDGRAHRYGQEEEVHIYHLLALDTTDIIMCGHSSEKTTMMNALVKEAKDVVLEKFLEARNEEPTEEEEEEVRLLAQEELDACNDKDLKEKKAKPKKRATKPKVNPKAKDKAKLKASVVDAEGGDNMKVPAMKDANAAASSSKSSTQKAASAVAPKIIDINSDDDESDVPIKTKLAARHTVVDSESQEETTTGKGRQPAGKGKQPAGSKRLAKRKLSDIVSDEEASMGVKGKEVEGKSRPPSKKAKRTNPKLTSSESSRMMREGAAWKAKKDAAAATAATTAASSSGTTVDPPTPTPLPPGMSFYLFCIPTV